MPRGLGSGIARFPDFGTWQRAEESDFGGRTSAAVSTVRGRRKDLVDLLLGVAAAGEACLAVTGEHSSSALRSMVTARAAGGPDLPHSGWEVRVRRAQS
jgi:hypothetical protein